MSERRLRWAPLLLAVVVLVSAGCRDDSPPTPTAILQSIQREVELAPFSDSRSAFFEDLYGADYFADFAEDYGARSTELFSLEDGFLLVFTRDVPFSTDEITEMSKKLVDYVVTDGSGVIAYEGAAILVIGGAPVTDESPGAVDRVEEALREA